MKTLSLQITYRKGKPFAAYIYLPNHSGQKTIRSEKIRPGLIVDFDGDENPVGIEVISPGVTSIEELEEVFDEVNLERPDRKDLDPIAAA